jgi:MFS family permease
MVFMTGLIGVATTSISYTKAVNGWFSSQRGLALAFRPPGISLAAIVVPPLLERIITLEGWRTGYFMLSALALLIGLPSILFLVADIPPRGPTMTRKSGDRGRARSFLSQRCILADRAVSHVGINIACLGDAQPDGADDAGGGADIGTGSIGISAFAAGQFFGRLACGWLLDRVNPQRTAFFFTLIPAVGCVLLWQTQNYYAAALFAVAAIGVQQGAEIDLLAYFVARRFGLDRYGSIYGWMQVAGWMGTLCGVLLFGKIHDWTGKLFAVPGRSGLFLCDRRTAFLFVRLPPQRVFT